MDRIYCAVTCSAKLNNRFMYKYHLNVAMKQAICTDNLNIYIIYYIISIHVYNKYYIHYYDHIIVISFHKFFGSNFYIDNFADHR